MKTEMLRECIRIVRKGQTIKDQDICLSTTEEALDELTAWETENAAMKEKFDTATWIEWGNTAWQRINGRWHVLERDGEDWAIIDRISDEEAALSPPTGKMLVDREKLREIEWDESDWPALCPACNGSKPKGHEDTCWLAALLEMKPEDLHAALLDSQGGS